MRQFLVIHVMYQIPFLFKILNFMTFKNTAGITVCFSSMMHRQNEKVHRFYETALQKKTESFSVVV